MVIRCVNCFSMRLYIHSIIIKVISVLTSGISGHNCTASDWISCIGSHPHSCRTQQLHWASPDSQGTTFEQFMGPMMDGNESDIISSNSNSLREINPIKIGFNLSEIWLNLLQK